MFTLLTKNVRCTFEFTDLKNKFPVNAAMEGRMSAEQRTLVAETGSDNGGTESEFCLLSSFVYHLQYKKTYQERSKMIKSIK